MIEQLLHYIGICPDHLSHLNLVDLLLFTPAAYVVFRAKALFYKIKGKK